MQCSAQNRRKKKIYIYQKTLRKDVEYDEWNARWTVPDCLTSRKPEVPCKNRTGIAFNADGPELVEAVRLPFQYKSETFDSTSSFFLYLLSLFLSLSLTSFVLLLHRSSSFRRRKPEVRVYAFAIKRELVRATINTNARPIYFCCETDYRRKLVRAEALGRFELTQKLFARQSDSSNRRKIR